MHFTKIKIRNYKQYYGEQSITIPNKNKIIVIMGENGAGKTNFINGLTWCLYHEKSDFEDLFNDKALQELETEKSLDMYIEIHFEHENSVHILKRKVTAQKQADNKYKFNEDYTLEVISDAEIRKVNPINIESYINNILNESVKSYFFFDGARIETFTKDDHNKDVEKAIKNLLKIETIIRSRDHIKSVIDEIRKSMGDNFHDSSLVSLKNEIDKLEEDLSFCNGEIENLSNEISAVDRDISNTKGELEHIQRNSLYKEQFSEYRKRKTDKQEKLSQLEKEINSQLKKCYKCFSDKLMDDASLIIKKQTSDQKKFTYSVILKEAIKESLSSDKCFVCEEPITKEKRNQLLSKLPELVGENTNFPLLIEQSNSFTSLKKEGQEVFKAITQLKKRCNEYIKEIDEYTNILNDLETKIDNDCPDTKEHKVMLEKLENRKQEKNDKKIRLEERSSLIRRKIKEKELEHNELIKKYEKFKHEQKKIEICFKIRDELDRIFEMYEKNEIQKINQETKHIFDQIIRKEDVFKSVYIDDSYNLNITREFSNKNILKQLSYGERQILSLSLIFALANISGDQGPFVMDTPMGNLDPVHRRKLLDNVTKFVNQIFFLVTSAEFTEDLYNVCYNDISAQFSLVTRKKGITEIIAEGKYARN